MKDRQAEGQGDFEQIESRKKSEKYEKKNKQRDEENEREIQSGSEVEEPFMCIISL